MSLRTVYRWTLWGGVSMSLLLASACKDDDNGGSGTTDAGGMGDDDGSSPPPPPPPNEGGSGDGIPCGDLSCEDQGVYSACCAGENMDRCGINLDPLKEFSEGVPFEGCYEYMAPGVDSMSCGEQFDLIDGDAKDGTPNGRFDLALPIGDGAEPTVLSFDPCCTADGECGVEIDRVEIMGGIMLNLGCVGAGVLAPDMGGPGDAGSGDGGPPMSDPDDSPLPIDEAGLPIVPNFVCDAMGQVPCNPDLPFFFTGACPAMVSDQGTPGDTTDDCVPGVDEFVGGCGAMKPWENDLAALCIPNVAEDIFGCVDIAEAPNCPGDSGICMTPEFICGCGEGVPGGGPCLPNVSTSICGQGAPVDETGGCLVGFEEFVAACAADVVWDPEEEGTGSFCVNNATPGLVGCVAVTQPATCPDEPTPEDSALCNVPPFVCGCGDGVTSPGCLPNVPENICGAADLVDDTNNCIVGFEEFVFGCGEGQQFNPQADPAFCVGGVSEAVSGCVEVTQAPTMCTGNVMADSGLCSVPPFICGCGDGVVAPGCLANIPTTVCGAGDIIDEANNCIEGFEEFASGCGEGQQFNPAVDTVFCVGGVSDALFGCTEVSQEPAVCTGVPQVDPGLCSVPPFLCGCGDGVAAPGCLPNIPGDVCGVSDIVDETNNCIEGFEEFVFGCGEGEFFNPQVDPAFCVGNVDESLAGCDEVTEAPAACTGNPQADSGLCSVPPFICGCGDGVVAPGCLANIPDTVCGAGDIIDETNNCIEGFEEFVFGCGAGVQWNPIADPAFCVGGVDETLYGCDSVTEEPAVCTGNPQVDSGLCSVPPFLCGCGDSVAAPGCLANIPQDVCGQGDIIDETNNCIEGFEEFVFGCGVDAQWNPLVDPAFCVGGVSDVLFGCDEVTQAPAVCTGVPQVDSGLCSVPPFLCGCGDGVIGGGCLANIPTDVCGQGDIIDETNNCIEGFEEFIRGCGLGVQWNPATDPAFCVGGVSNALYGCDDVTQAPAVCTGNPALDSGLCSVPSLVCGCGDGVTGAGDCLAHVDTQICGADAGCDAEGASGAAGGCANNGETCLDLFPLPGGDDVGDFCACDPALDTGPGGIIDTCGGTDFACKTVNTGFADVTLCDCGLLGGGGDTCTTGVCTDTNGDGFGDACVNE